MFQQLKNKIVLSAIITPIYAAELQIGPQGSDFSPLKDVTINSVLSGAINLALILVIIVFFFMLVLGGLKWITGGGDEKKVGEARSQITNALIGLAIIFSVWAILSLIDQLFGLSILKGLSIPSFTKSSL